LERLKAERGPIAIQIRKAAADKDVRENAPLEAAREQLGYLESRISSLEATLRTSVVIDPSQQQVAQNAKVGTRVSIKDLSNGREMSYTLVSAFEANPLEGRISDVSPMGKALVGHATGQEVEAVTPRGKVRYRILEIST
jgi:transcription elongation factor GreA